MTRKQLLLTAITIVGIATLLLGPQQFLYTKYSPISFICLVIGGTILLITALEYKQDRFTKGLLLIGLAISFPAIYPLYLNYVIHPNKLPEVFEQQLSIFSQIIVLACSGAGGSIIANYGDTNTTEFKKANTTHPTIIESTKNLEQLTKQTKELKQKILLLTAVSLTTLAITIITLATVNLK